MQNVVEGLIDGTYFVVYRRRIIHPEMWSQVFQNETERLWNRKARKMTLKIQGWEPYNKTRELNLPVVNKCGLKRAGSNPTLRLDRPLPDGEEVEPKSIAKIARKRIAEGANLDCANNSPPGRVGQGPPFGTDAIQHTGPGPPLGTDVRRRIAIFGPGPPLFEKAQSCLSLLG